MQTDRQTDRQTDDLIRFICHVFKIKYNKLNKLRILNGWNNFEFKTVKSFMDEKVLKVITPSIKIKSNEYKILGKYPIVSQELDFISGYTDEEDKNINIDQYVCFGDHSEHIKYIPFKFVQGADGLKIIKTENKSIINPKYFYYNILNFYEKHNNYERHYKYLLDTNILSIPLEVQEEIVNILDKFEEYINSIESGLQGEIEARHQQYEYYRDKLLTFNRKEV